MSLTSFILESVELRHKVSALFPKPDLSLTAKKQLILCQPKSNRYNLIGTAFDYLFRAFLQRINNDSVVREWVTEDESFVDFHDAKTARLISKINNKAKTDFKKYIKSGFLDDSLYISCLKLATIEHVYRSGMGSEHIGKFYIEDVEELKNLYVCIPKDSFFSERNCYLNPDFGDASCLVQGADADIILNNTIIEIKTTKEIKLDNPKWHQLICYYILYCMGGINGKELDYDESINKLGIYWSRYGFYESYDITHIAKDENFKSFMCWFKETAENHFKIRD